jgi:phosphoribosylformylglycinamidine cyclo-ligase
MCAWIFKTKQNSKQVLHFVKDLHVIKDNLFPIPPLFKLIQAQSGTDSREMYKVFNMGHRMEIYCHDAQVAQSIIEVSKSFNVDAQVIGRCEALPVGETTGKLTITSELGEFNYP